MTRFYHEPFGGIEYRTNKPAVADLYSVTFTKNEKKTPVITFLHRK